MSKDHGSQSSKGRRRAGADGEAKSKQDLDQLSSFIEQGIQIFLRSHPVPDRETMLEDVFEDCLSVVLQALEGGEKPIRDLESWLRRVIRNKCADRLREACRSSNCVSIEELGLDGLNEPAQEPGMTWLLVRLHRDFERLTPEQQTALRLRIQERRTFKEIAIEMKLSVSQVKYLVRTALAELRKCRNLRSA